MTVADRDGVPRLRLTAAAFAAASGAPGGPDPAVLGELAAAGALVRDGERVLLPDPALRAVLVAWAAAPVAVEVVTGTPSSPRQLLTALAPPLAVCVLRVRAPGETVAVEVSVPGPARLRAEVLHQLAAPAATTADPVWWRVHTATDGAGSWWRGTPEDATPVLTAALDVAAAAAGPDRGGEDP